MKAVSDELAPERGMSRLLQDHRLVRKIHERGQPLQMRRDRAALYDGIAEGEGSMSRPILARDLGNGPFKPFGSALIGGDGGHVERCPRIGPTRRLMSEPPCPVCGNKSAWRCDCEDAE
jgi:hypothetical protein